MNVVLLDTQRGEPSRKGGVLVLALVAVLLVSAFSAAFLQLGQGVTRRQMHAVDTRQAFYLAETGLAEAYTGLALARTGNVGTETAPAALGGGLFWVEATPLDGGLTRLESTGMWGLGRATLGMVVEPVVESVSAQGFFSSNDIRIEPGTVIDSFDSTAGSYEDQLMLGINLDQTRLGSNGNVSIGGGAKGTLIHGDVVHGPSSALTTDGSVTITGSIAPAGDPVFLPEVEFPGLVSSGDLHHGKKAGTLVIPSGDVAHGHLTLEADAVIVGPATVELGQLTVHSGVELRIDTTSGPVEIYVHEHVEFSSGSSVTCTQQDPTQVSLQVGAPMDKQKRNVVLSADARFFGAIYAPRSEVYMASGFEIFGAALADQLVLSQGGRYHFDIRGLAGGAALPILRNWRVVDISDSIAGRGADPFETLGIDPGDCPAPADAHQDQILAIVYVDHSGAKLSYEGWESAFVWAEVAEVLSASRDGKGFRAPSDRRDEDDPTEELPAQEQAVMHALADPSVTSHELKDLFDALSPVSSTLLIAALLREPGMETRDLKNVLQWNGPYSESYPMGRGTDSLADGVLFKALSSPMLSRDLKNIYIQNSPLSESILAAVMASSAVHPGDKAKIMGAQ